MSTGLYIHIPFCTRRCGYCDFNTFAGQSHLIPNYVKSLCPELVWLGKKYAETCSIDSIFFGGGTPSLLTTDQFMMVFSSIHSGFNVEQGCEITIEANPGTVSANTMAELYSLGVNRVSFGMQSAHPGDLTILDRQHRFEDVLNAVTWSRKAGLRHINIDLIFGIPGQTMERWQQNLDLAVNLGVDHLSLYSLILEEGTPLERRYRRGLIELVDDDLTADMYEYAMDTLPEKGFFQYEISNFARMDGDADSRCRHNLNTWRYHPYFGVGAGAHGFINGLRIANVGLIPEYINKIQKAEGEWPASESIEKLDEWERMQEWMMVGLRLTEEGVSAAEFGGRFKVPMEKAFGGQLRKLMSEGLLEKTGNTGDRLRLTRKGILLGNRVFLEFVGNPRPDWLADQ